MPQPAYQGVDVVGVGVQPGEVVQQLDRPDPGPGAGALRHQTHPGGDLRRPGGRPSTVTVPASAGSSPVQQRISVVLPAPLGPSTAVSCPAAAAGRARPARRGPPRSPTGGRPPGRRRAWTRAESNEPHAAARHAAGQADAGQVRAARSPPASSPSSRSGTGSGLDHLPRRRRGGDRLAQREADDPLLPRGRRGGQGEPAGAVRGRRRDRRRGRGPARVRGAAAAHPPGGQPGEAALGARRRPASIAFDLLALGDEDFTQRPFAERRAALEEALAGVGRAGPPHPDHPGSRRGAGLVRPVRGRRPGRCGGQAPGGPYQPDKRTMFKIKHTRTADCVVAGYRVHKSGPDSIGSLLLGLYDDAGVLVSVGVIGAFPAARRTELFAELQPLVTTFDDHPWAWAKQEEGNRTPRNSEGSRWNNGKDLSFTPLAPGPGGRGPLRAHGGRAVPAHRPVQPLAAGPRPALVHVRAAGGTGQVRPGRHPGARRGEPAPPAPGGRE